MSRYALSNVIMLTKYNFNKQRQFQIDDRRCHDQHKNIKKILLNLILYIKIKY